MAVRGVGDGSSDEPSDGLADGPVAFSRQDFLVDSFAAADFVATHKHIPIDQLRHDLNGVLRVLKGELVELINNDYAQFISLSTNLVGVDSMISDLKRPIQSIHAAVQNTQDALDRVIERLETGLKERALIRTKRAALEVFLSIHQSLEKVQAVIEVSSGTDNNSENTMDEILIERVAIEYNQLQYLVSRGQSLAFVTNISWKIEEIKNTLVSTLSKFVRQAYLAISINPSDADATSSLLQSLRIFVLIDRVKDALSVFRETILEPFIQENINAESVDLVPAAGSTEKTLGALLELILTFVRTKCLRIYTITSAALKNTSYDILTDIIWPGIIMATVTRLPIIFNAGIPDVFHHNYQTFMHFVQQFELFCSDMPSLYNLRNQQSYSEFMRKWQLSIYFQIRHNEVATKLETGLEHGREQIEGNTFDSFGLQLRGTQAFLAALQQSWDKDVHLGSLSFRFWNLTLLIIGRYADWVSQAITEDLMLLTSSSVSSVTVMDTPVVDSVPSATLAFYSDIVKIRTHILNTFNTHISPKLPVEALGDNILYDSLISAIGGIEASLPAVTGRIVTHFTNKCVDPLRSGVKHIPRLYRSTNHEAPNRCSYFISAVFKPLTAFINTNYVQLDKQTIDAWKKEVSHGVSRQYLEQVKETLASVKQIEESLKRFKKAKKNSTSGVADETLSDDDKIRLQIQIDIEQYGEELSLLGLSPLDDVSFVSLKGLELSRSNS
ncbi:hypothetical protein BASA50_003234 [Batrachochytrium salamandrivorans]|uniref:Conserved oligomeric Golgi complex subunit 2 n=1 Tax=Batrachochytrium salamandrivorans TaxID=1357716 RepID=A0ABQ8FM37_9FUNG|nr:hypothetical protein BASA50_003234 [Batrachochytrium salamandrivorans]